MALDKRTGLQLTLSYDDDNTGTTFNTVTSLIDLRKFGGATTDEIDTTVHSDSFRDSEPGQTDPGTIEFDYYWDPGFAECVELYGLAASKEKRKWRVTLAAVGAGTAKYQQATGYIQSHEVNLAKDSKLVATVVVKCKGTPFTFGTPS